MKKTGILFLRKRLRSEKEQEKFRRTKEEIKGYPITMEYKYLGIKFDETLKFKSHREYIEGKLEKGMKIVKILLWKGVSI